MPKHRGTRNMIRMLIKSVLRQQSHATTAEIMEAFETTYPVACAHTRDWPKFVQLELRRMQRLGTIAQVETSRVWGWQLSSRRRVPHQMTRWNGWKDSKDPRDRYTESWGVRAISGGLPSLGKRR